MARNGECRQCEQAITHPVCMACLEEQMEAWLRDRRPELIPELRATADELWMPTQKSQCILCKHKMNVCTHCFTRHILDWLDKYPRLKHEYVDVFNYGWDEDVQPERVTVTRR